MKIILTNHAKKRMRQRGVGLDEIKKTIRYPDSVKSQPEPHKKRASKIFGRRTLDVVYEENNGRHIIVTVIWLGEKDRQYHVN